MTSIYGSSISSNPALPINRNVVPLIVLLLVLQTTATVIHPHVVSTLTAAQAVSSHGKNLLESSEANATSNRKNKQLVLVIDVDNTLYNEKEKGIERQIAQNIYKFCQKRLNYTQEYCDQLHQEYGSTIEGIRHNLLRHNKNHSFQTNGSNITVDNDVHDFLIDTLQAFYQEVYDNVDVTPLLRRFSHSRLPNNTGYLHDVEIDAQQTVFPLVQLLQSLPCPVYIASNSPLHHVLKVLSALGMRRCNFAGILTPDHYYYNRTTAHHSFPTKSSPRIFFESLLTKHPLDQHRVILLDDSLYSLQKASQCGIDGILISHSNDNDAVHSGTLGVTLQQGLGYALQYDVQPFDDGSIGRNGVTTSLPSINIQDDQGNNQTYKFSDIRYLESKNYIDTLSINEQVWNHLIQEVSLLNLSNKGELHVVDLGCGLLSMLQSLLYGVKAEREASTSTSKINNNYNTNNHNTTYIRSNNTQVFRFSTMTSWLQRRRKKYVDACAANKTNVTLLLPSFVDSIPAIKEIHYYAYEVNQNLLVSCQEKLRNMGFLPVQNELSENNGSEYIFTGTVESQKKDTVVIRVYLRFRDFACDTFLRPIHLLIGCCFADLFDSETLSKNILRFVSTRDKLVEQNVLMYFPITHAGTTSFLPPSPLDDESNIPSDTIAFRLYSESLANRHGQCVDATRFVDELEKVGAELIAKRSSNWNIDPNKHSYLWATLLHFFEKCTFPELILHRWNATGWLDRARKLRPSIYVSNVDLLFRLQQSTAVYQNLNHDISTSQDVAQKTETVKEIKFTSRQKVEVVEKQWSLRDDDDVHLGPDFVELESICSLISSGTELKIFNGFFEEAQPLDVGIKEMKHQTMAYPMGYGYSLVGRIKRCGSNVSGDVVGKLAFAFSCHSSRAVVHKDSIQLIPSGIAPEDAIFFPSVETALSVVHDANIRVGENVAVFGQGLIGLLVTHILCLSRPRSLDGSARFGTITVLDTMPDRLAVASLLGASQALLPSGVKPGSFFDVCIEVSGNERALQSAIDSACDGGRIIIASWYGNASVRLNLGTAFHRSHKTVIASQVSRIPGHLQMTWTKPRRFALAWELLRAMQPSKYLLTKTVEIVDAQAAYELLNAGKEIAVAIKY